MITEPPLSAGAAHETSAEVLPADAVTLVGAPGRPNGLTKLEATEAAEFPRALAALTVNA